MLVKAKKTAFRKRFLYLMYVWSLRSWGAFAGSSITLKCRMLLFCVMLFTVFAEELSWLCPVICSSPVSWGLQGEEGLYSKEQDLEIHWA